MEIWRVSVTSKQVQQIQWNDNKWGTRTFGHFSTLAPKNSIKSDSPMLDSSPRDLGIESQNLKLKIFKNLVFLSVEIIKCAPWPGIEPGPPEWESGILTPRPSGTCCHAVLIIIYNKTFNRSLRRKRLDLTYTRKTQLLSLNNYFFLTSNREMEIHAKKCEQVRKDMEAVFQNKVDERLKRIRLSEIKLQELQREVYLKLDDKKAKLWYLNTLFYLIEF